MFTRPIHRRKWLATTGGCAAAAWLTALPDSRIGADGRKKKKEELYGPPRERLGSSRTQAYNVGIEVTALNGPIGALFATIPVPVDWPEQQVRLDNEEFSPSIRDVRYRQLDHRIRQMLVSIPALPPGETARAVLRLEIERWSISPPEDPTGYQSIKRLPKPARGYLGSGPLIETRSSKIREQGRIWSRQKLQGWELVETVYDWVRDNIQVVEGEKPKGALKALEARQGHYEDVTGLFVALCRTVKIPARMVFLPKMAYAEFMLADAAGRPEWLPCRVAGEREIGGVNEFRPILQKGDRVRVPEKKDPLRFVGEYVRGKKLRGGGKPKIRFIRELN